MNNKLKTILLFSVFTAAMFGGAAVGSSFIPWYYGLIIGAASFVPFGVLAYVFRNKPFVCVAALAVNGFFSGLAASTYYVIGKPDFDLVFSLVITGAAIILFAVIAIISNSVAAFEHPVIFSVIVCAPLLISGIVFWIVFDSAVFSYYMFMAVAVSCFLFALISGNESDSDVYINAWISSFAAFVLVAIIVLIVISEGEALEGLDFAPGGGKKPKKK